MQVTFQTQRQERVPPCESPSGGCRAGAQRPGSHPGQERPARVRGALPGPPAHFPSCLMQDLQTSHPLISGQRKATAIPPHPSVRGHPPSPQGARTPTGETPTGPRSQHRAKQAQQRGVSNQWEGGARKAKGRGHPGQRTQRKAPEAPAARAPQRPLSTQSPWTSAAKSPRAS